MSETVDMAAGRCASGWRKSSHSNPSGNCVELAELGNGMVAIRNSRLPDAGVLVFTRAELAAFVSGAKDGEFDDLAP